ncbi:MAG: UDP-N-acetylmuramoyl-L-alanyl-D-glutamate--2,6-diaminopimelate ligase [Alphaproteobacteria bacterium]
MGAISYKTEIVGLTADSRSVRPGFLFAALPGVKQDGRQYIEDAIARGAVAILASHEVSLPQGKSAALITDINPRRSLALIASSFYAGQPEIMVAVTGTNGKTSVALFFQQLWTALGKSSAAIGTIGVVTSKSHESGFLTTPDAIELHKILVHLSTEGITHGALEASSHGLDQYRLDGVQLAAAAFTNLTRDHLDYHVSMEAYQRAKLRLFSELLLPGSGAVLNADAKAFPVFEKVARQRKLSILDYGHKGRKLTLTYQEPRSSGQIIGIRFLDQKEQRLNLPLVGEFQATNCMAALGLVISTGGDYEAALHALEKLPGVPGRMERVAQLATGGVAFVDYAHTPDALETVLRALRPHYTGKLIVVFGCGGDRDRGKRSQMGRIASMLADQVIITDDNPRTENPALIRTEILVACPGAQEVGDRTEAIMVGLQALGSNDALLVAGKGHETGQIVGDKILPFDDRTVIIDLARQGGLLP